ncbi:hypothetical protein [Rathayibacter soli]|uniref:hypothetical protein n=1 Tax=Rathayibacter soli TaxID=3144168 RepID=UPI0027E5B627|nr:hypothetical protein [Glaciibacter superstes]
MGMPKSASTTMKSVRAGTMIIRLIAKQSDNGGFRARLTFESSVTGEPVVQYATTLEQLIEVVRDWAIAETLAT